MIRFDVGFRLIRQQLKTQFASASIFPVLFESNVQRLPISFDKFVVTTVTKDVDYYDGDYSVIPKVTRQTLPTEKKFLGSDIKVEKIPIFDVSNTSGGTTIYIADII